jgi:hypothetical protein
MVAADCRISSSPDSIVNREPNEFTEYIGTITTEEI